LAESLREKKPIYVVHAPLKLETFEQDLGALNELLGEIGEIITTLPSADDSGEGIHFDIVCASSQPPEDVVARVSALAEGRYRTERVDRVAAPAAAAPR